MTTDTIDDRTDPRFWGMRWNDMYTVIAADDSLEVSIFCEGLKNAVNDHPMASSQDWMFEANTYLLNWRANHRTDW